MGPDPHGHSGNRPALTQVFLQPLHRLCPVTRPRGLRLGIWVTGLYPEWGPVQRSSGTDGVGVPQKPGKGKTPHPQGCSTCAVSPKC